MNTKYNTPINSLQGIRFCALVGTESELQGDTVVGRWKSTQEPFYGLPRKQLLLEQFLNWSSEDQHILRFIRKYGPLYQNWIRGGKFWVRRSIWSTWQSRLRGMWESLMNEPHYFRFKCVIDGASFSYKNSRFEFRVDQLATFLYIEMASCDRRRLRKCLADGCKAPYFVARHLGQRYCCNNCATWAQREFKKNWWKEKGAEWRKQHPRSGINGHGLT